MIPLILLNFFLLITYFCVVDSNRQLFGSETTKHKRMNSTDSCFNCFITSISNLIIKTVKDWIYIIPEASIAAMACGIIGM